VDPLILTYTVFFASAALLAWILTPLAACLARRVGLVDQPGERKIHERAMPYGGGIAIYATMVILVGAAYLLVLAVRDRGADDLAALPAPLADLAQTLRPHIRGLLSQATLGRLGAMLLGSTVIFVLGLVDDWHRLRARHKLCVQTLAAILVVAAGVRGTFFVENAAVGALVSVGWIVVVTNAFNLLDNMDGLSAGVAFVASALFLVVALQAEQIFVAAFLAVFAGTLLGFLRHNFAPARLFMGDAGSLLIGFVLSCLTISGTYYEGQGNLVAICMPVLILGVPLFDTASVIYIRRRQGKSLFDGDTNHFSHRLVRLGMTVREAVLTIYLLGLILGGAATLLKQVDQTGAIIILLLGLGVIMLIVLLENAAARRERL